MACRFNLPEILVIDEERMTDDFILVVSQKKALLSRVVRPGSRQHLSHWSHERTTASLAVFSPWQSSPVLPHAHAGTGPSGSPAQRCSRNAAHTCNNQALQAAATSAQCRSSSFNTTAHPWHTPADLSSFLDSPAPKSRIFGPTVWN